MRTGILGGTFDPIHIAHLHAGETVLHQADLDRVLFMPAGYPWQKTDRALTAGHHRMEMTRLAVEGVDGLALDGREMDREGPTYTLDTLDSFPTEEELFLVLGADAAMGLPTWHRSDEVLERAGVLVVPRAGTDSTAVAEVLPDAGFVDMAVLEVSGTEIRALAQRGDPFRFLVAAAVHAYILEHDLYGKAFGDDMVGHSTETEESS